MPRYVDIPGYEGVLIHIGNYVKDTNGCTLVGQNTQPGMVCNSRKTFYNLYDILKKADEQGREIYVTFSY